MAVSVKKKCSFGHLQQSHAKMCIQDFCNKNMAAPPVSWPTPMRAIGAQNLLTMPGGVTTSGYLHKKGGSQFSLMKWPLRFIIIHKGCIYYFKSSTSAAPQGAFSLNGYNRVLRAAEETTSSNVFPFKIVHFSKRHRTWYFSAASEDERRKWMRHLRKEIGYYNDKRDLSFPSDDLDSESIYGQLEEPLEISPIEEDPEADYMTQDEDSDGEDISPISTGRPTVPPPPYPPPPVPVQPRENRLTKGPPPPLPPPFKKPSCTSKGPPPPLPYAPHLEKPDTHLSNRGHAGSMSPLPPPTNMKPMKSGPFSTMPACEKKLNVSLMSNKPATLPIVENLQKVILNSSKPSISGHHLGLKPTPDSRPVSPHLSSSVSNRVLGQIPKPPIPGKPKPSRPSIQRASPDGQSFRSSIEEKPLKNRVHGKIKDDSDDEDYENVNLPNSVFVDTMETSNVERLFKDTYVHPQNGLYCIRKSGTGKTSQVLVVWDSGINKARNYRLFEEDQRVYLEADLTFPTLSALVENYHINPLPSSNNSLPNYSLCLHQPFGYDPPR